MDLLDYLQQDDTSPPCLGGDFAPQAHLHDKFKKFYELKGTGSPLVFVALVRPCSGETSVEGRGNERSVVSVSFDNFCKESVMIHAHYIEQRSD